MKTVRKSRAKKTRSVAKIREALAYWKGRMAQLNEAKKTEDEAKDEAENNPVGEFDPASRFIGMHKFAVGEVQKIVSKVLHNKVDTQDVHVYNSAVKGNDFDASVDKITVKIAITVDKAKVKGFRKALAALVGETEQIDERGWFKSITKSVRDNAAQNIGDPNSALKEKVGLEAMKMYFKNFFGKRLAAAISRRNVFVGQAGEGTALEYVFCASVAIKY